MSCVNRLPLKLIYDWLQELSDQAGADFDNADVRWVITVPAIWKMPAKQFMREAAYKVSFFLCFVLVLCHTRKYTQSSHFLSLLCAEYFLCFLITIHPYFLFKPHIVVKVNASRIIRLL